MIRYPLPQRDWKAMSSAPVEFDPSDPTIRWGNDSLEKMLDATNRAKRDAAQGEPASDADHCPFLDDVRHAVEDVAKRAKTEVEDYFKSIVEQTKAVAGAPGALIKAQNDALAGMRRVVDYGINTTSPLADRVKSVNQEHTDFTMEHGLIGRAADPKNTKVWWIILVSAGFELLINGWTLGTAHPSGFIGVSSEILLFTAVNVLLGLLAGAAMRHTNYRPGHSLRSIGAWMAVVLCVILVLLFSYVFGHYRDALVGLQSSIAEGDYESYVRLWATLFRTALASAFSSDWIPQTMQTVVLIAAGWAISGIVAFEWYRSDDRYPGFGRITRKREQAQELYVREVEGLNQRIHDFAETASQELTSIEGSVLAAKELPDTAASCKAAYAALIAELNRFGKAQLRAYRLASTQVRPWPKSLESAVEAPVVSANVASPPQMPDGAGVDDAEIKETNELRLRCYHVVSQARQEYGTKVFAPVPALHPRHPEYERFANPVGMVRTIAESIEQLT